MAPLQKRALYSFLIGLIFTIALAVILIIEGGIAAFDTSEILRWMIYAALIGVPLAYLLLIDLSLRKPTELDERDRFIILKANRIQWLAVIFSIVIWVIALTETYHVERQVPVDFLTLIMISILIISTLAQSLGILIGYWKTR
ncbi:MAG: hypothetical protein PHF74_07000 [Dehalococcoidales bacterium]|nr:hypothetical protein [Dehalococcoidales bacterium]